LTLATDNFRIKVLEAEIRALEYRRSDQLRRLESNSFTTGTSEAQTGTPSSPVASITPLLVPSTILRPVPSPTTRTSRR
jgi:hypothetical protein